MQTRYKRNYDNRLRKQSEKIQEDDYVYLRVERRDEREHRHKLAAVAEGPYRVIETKENTVVIERQDKSVERVSRSRVVLAPQPRTVMEIQNAVRPMTDEEVLNDEYPISEEVNKRDLSRRSPRSDARRRHPSTRMNEQSAELPVDSNNKTPQGDKVIDKPAPRRSNRLKHHGRYNNARVHTRDEHDGTSDTDGQYVMEKIFNHDVNEDESHPHAKVGEILYRIRWYGYEAKDDTLEPINHLPRSKLLSYYRRRKLPLPTDLHRAMLG